MSNQLVPYRAPPQKFLDRVKIKLDLWAWLFGFKKFKDEE